MKIVPSKSLFIDSSKGGNGDIWMRLVGFYVAAKLFPQCRITVIVPRFIENIAFYTFGDRIGITSNTQKINFSYTTLGFKNILPELFKGKKFITPYQRAVIHDKKNKRIKDIVNIAIFSIANWLGFVKVPTWKAIELYQSFLEIVGLKEFSKIPYSQFVYQLNDDYNTIFEKLQSGYPLSHGLTFPEDLNTSIIIFPTGTSRQFIPLWWAKCYYPNAYYAFFYKDKTAKDFIDSGLKTVFFYQEPGDIIKLSQLARWTITTDSFPSHLLQYSNKRCTVTITEVLKSRIISPAFEGKVVNSLLSCHPCLHLDRNTHPLCEAGYSECLNWSDPLYTKLLQEFTI